MSTAMAKEAKQSRAGSRGRMGVHCEGLARVPSPLARVSPGVGPAGSRHVSVAGT